ncbi:MAG: bifunctional UDP-N-acetylglucosamine diphosphorylase/glucosamine-1-phosphate N-acetyltransferase GlmU [Bdellovibrionales bacterium]|nr:bifunctional UDP-N-acetylglucosamine diphosphorylase/glucosamine-1-phosphate N-acetyltransferase GlmU [Bdellovibrionales bacterium]
MNKSPFSVIILAAGKGTRMKSPLSKVLHPVAGIPMIKRVVQTAKDAGATEVRVVVGENEDLVRQVVEPMGAICFVQKEQKGTANAVLSAQIDSLEGVVVILNGDHPLIEPQDLKKIVKDFYESSGDLALVTLTVDDPGHYGRVVRHQGQIKAIVEFKDAGHEARKINEINTGIYAVRSEVLKEYLPLVKSENSQNEFYLTDLVTLASENRLKVEAIEASPHLAQGVNTQWELALVGKEIYRRKIKALMDEGVVVIDPDHTYVESTVRVGSGSVLFPNVHLKGLSQLGNRVVVESQSIINDSTLADGVVIKAGSSIEQSKISFRSQVGPYAHLRPGTEVGEDCKIGNFVELKKVKFGSRSKASHLTYLGDAIVGEDTNIGCGTITCNYAVDHKKYVTTIGNHVFVGSDTQFIAPVTVGDYAVIGSGSTITKNVPVRGLAVARGRQIIKENYVPKAPDQESEENK